MRELRHGIAERVANNLDDTRVRGLLKRYDIDPDGDDLRDRLSALPEDEFNHLAADYRRTTEADALTEISLRVERLAEQLWADQVAIFDQRSADIKNKMIPEALALRDAGDEAGLDEKLKDITAESISIVTDVHQQRLSVREQLRRKLLDIAPHLSRPERNGIVDEKASAENLAKTPLYTPPSTQQQARDLADLKRQLNEQELSRDADLDVAMAARMTSSPRP